VSVDVVKVAAPVLIVPMPRAVEPSRKATMPVALARVAVKVTD
jgi:hypothetical protein